MMTITPFEHNSLGELCHRYTLTNKNRASVQLCDLGASILSITVPDQNGILRDVVLGFNHISGYEFGDTYFGATVGRCCARIRSGRFTLNGKAYQLAVNNDTNHLHGGIRSWNRLLWEAQPADNRILFTLTSPDGDENYPGTVQASALYIWDDENCLTIEYRATTDADTLCNMTNHVAFNLNGHTAGTVTNHTLQIYSSHYIPLKSDMTPTGEIAPVTGTPFDFTQGAPLCALLDSDHPQLIPGLGLDHMFVLNKEPGTLSLSGVVRGDQSGIILDCYTTQPGLHIYSGNFLNVTAREGKDGTAYHKQTGLCLETQGYPNAINEPNFPSVILKAGEEYCHITKYRFKTISS